MLWTILGIAVIGYGLACATLFFRQRSFLYFPTAKVDHPFEVEVFENQGETVEVIVVDEGGERSIIYFGGNAETVAYNGIEFRDRFPGMSVYLVNYRGYAGSSGGPSEKALFDDALHKYDKLAQRHESIVVIGRSLGSGVATYLASMRPVEKLVLITPYDSIRAVGQSQYPIFPVGLLLKDHFDSASRVSKVGADTLVVLADSDRVIPVDSSKRLIAAFPNDQIRVETIENTDHNDVTDTDKYYELLSEFLIDEEL